MDPQRLLDDVLREIGSRTGKPPKQSGSHWQCRCPAHEDKQASLSVSKGKNGVLMKCFAGCDVETIATAIGMEVKDLFYGGRRTSARERKKSAEGGRPTLTPPAPSAPPPGDPPAATAEAPAPDDEDEGCSLAALAEAKGFSVAYLQTLGLEQIERQGRPAVRIPYWLEDGTPAPRTRLRVGLATGRRFLWEGHEEDGAPTLYGLWRLAEARAKGTLILVEGESDCWTLWAAGFAALGLPGASMAAKIEPGHLAGIERIAIIMEPDQGGEKMAHGVADRLEEIGWHGIVRVATCAPHKDPNALWLATTVSAEGGRPTTAEDGHPPLPSEIVGPDPGRFASTFRARLRAARPVGAVVERPIELLPGEVADLFTRDAEDGRMFTDRPGSGAWSPRRLIYHREIFHEFTGRCYDQLTESELRAWIAGFIRSRSWVNRKGRVERGNPTRPLTGNVALNLSHQALVPSHVSPPVWADGSPATDMLVLRNGILDVPALMRAWDDERHLGDDVRARVAAALRPHTPDLFSTIALPYEWRADAACPRWEAFIERVLPSQGLREVAQQWCGYCLLPTQWAQKIAIFHGEGMNGKSVFMAVLKRLVGEANCSATPLEFLHLPHMQEPLVGKLINLATEWGHIEQGGLNLLKSISGGDPILVNPKNRAPYTTMIYARFVVATNDPPRLSDRTDATWRRLLTIPFPVTIPMSERRPLDALVNDLCEELPGILVWALRGLWQLYAARGFADVPETEALKQEYQADANPVPEWCANNLTFADGELLLTERMYTCYRTACRDAGRHPLKDTSFGKEFVRWYTRERGCAPTRRKVQRDTGGRSWAYLDITLASGDGGSPGGTIDWNEVR